MQVYRSSVSPCRVLWSCRRKPLNRNVHYTQHAPTSALARQIRAAAMFFLRSIRAEPAPESECAAAALVPDGCALAPDVEPAMADDVTAALVVGVAIAVVLFTVEFKLEPDPASPETSASKERQERRQILGTRDVLRHCAKVGRV